MRLALALIAVEVEVEGEEVAGDSSRPQQGFPAQQDDCRKDTSLKRVFGTRAFVGKGRSQRIEVN